MTGLTVFETGLALGLLAAALVHIAILIGRRK